MNVLVLCPYPPGVAPSQRFRFELFLDDPDIQYTISPFWSMTAWRRLYHAGNAVRKAIAFCAGFVKRVVLAFNIWRYDKVLVHREAVPFGPPWLEFLIAKVWRKPLIFDFDDAIWMPDPFQKLPGWAELFRCRQKTGWICRWSSAVICGNDWLGAYASRFTARVVTIPTAVDITHSHNRLKNHSDKPVTVGWTGSHSTLPFLMKVAPVLGELSNDGKIRVLVIADRDPGLPFAGYVFRQWSKETEIDDLLEMDIGIMPLLESGWSQGKCGFKAIQYLALGIPVVATPVGVSSEILGHGAHGKLCSTEKEWASAILELANSASLRENLGLLGRKFIADHYSSERWNPAFRKIVLDA